MSGTTADWIIDLVENLIKDGNYIAVDDILYWTNVDYLLEGPELQDALDILITLLTVTLPYQDNLAYRKYFYHRVYTFVCQLDDMGIKELIEGLE